MLKFKWDQVKNLKNYKKHGIWFEDASTIFKDQNSETFYDHIHSIEEDRYIQLGLSVKKPLLL